MNFRNTLIVTTCALLGAPAIAQSGTPDLSKFPYSITCEKGDSKWTFSYSGYEVRDDTDPGVKVIVSYRSTVNNSLSIMTSNDGNAFINYVSISDTTCGKGTKNLNEMSSSTRSGKAG